jgi:hypothetical protein
MGNDNWTMLQFLCPNDFRLRREKIMITLLSVEIPVRKGVLCCVDYHVQSIRKLGDGCTGLHRQSGVVPFMKK